VFSTTIPLDQITTATKLSQYVAALYPHPNSDQTRLLTRLGTGHCSGLTAMMLYGQWVELQPQHIDPLTACLIPRDDYTTLSNIQRKINSWNGDMNMLSQEDRKDFDYFLQLMSYFQYSQTFVNAGQGDLDHILKDTRGKTPKREFSIAGCFRGEHFLQEFGMAGEEQTYTTNLIETVGPHGRIVMISSGKHMSGFLRWGDKYFYYNSNQPLGMICMEQSLLLESIFRDHILNPMIPSSFGFRVFSFAEDKPVYPDVTDLLEALEVPASSNVPGYNFDLNALHLAAYTGCIDSFKYHAKACGSLLKAVHTHSTDGLTPLHYALLNNKNDFLLALKLSKHAFRVIHPKWGWTTLHCALFGGYHFLVPECIRMGVNINAQSFDGMTACLIAAKQNDMTALDALLSFNPDLDIATKDDGFTPLHFAAAHNNMEMVTSLLEHDANPLKRSKTGLRPSEVTNDPRIKRCLFKEEMRVKLSTCPSLPHKQRYGLFPMPLLSVSPVAAAAQAANKKFKT
jgi:hypothetical protein